MITVMKASAGSGKTYALAQKYINMLLASDDPREYRHILAVTFTNKATDEMKSRIIEELAKHPNPKAQRILSDILHDYSSFAVSTIDKFFQQTLRAFARELGQFGRYQVDLDKTALVDEAVDTILDQLDASRAEDRKMIDFIVENMEERIADGGSLDVESGLKSMAQQLKSENFNKKSAAIGLDREEAYSGPQLARLKASCHRVSAAFENKVRAAAQRILQASAAAGLDCADYNRGWLKFAIQFSEWDRKSGKEPTEAQMRKIDEPSAESWFTKKNQHLFASAQSAIGEPLEAFAQLWRGDDYRQFITAGMLLRQVYGLGIASRLFKAFDKVVKEKNVVCLDESNSLLRDIIDGSDAPFVYEKTGVRFRTFLLDEFQDTSVTQWDNFLPLLRESEANKRPDDKDHVFDNLIVGDVKQSIYRWRESDWGLLDHQVEASFPGHIHNEPLDRNWRSLQQLIDFNNQLYPALAQTLDVINTVPEGMHDVHTIYSSCQQTPGKPLEQQGGSVDIEFKDTAKDQIDAILDTIADLRDNHGATYGDVAVLVRRNNEGTMVAQALIDKGIPVVTEASLKLKNSISVRRLVSMMSYVDNPDDSVGAFIARRYGISSVPQAYHSLPDLAETLYRMLCVQDSCRMDCESEAMYVLSFMDCVADYAKANGNNLKEFLAYWQQKDPVVNAGTGSDAVRILTIHKSKGLAFPYVILPFLENISLYNTLATRDWSCPDVKDGELAQFADRLYFVPLNGNTDKSHFAAAYHLEKFNQGVDAINLLYVATTRAQKGMKLLAGTKENKEGGLQGITGTMSQLLYDYFGGKDTHLGTVYDFGAAHAASADAASRSGAQAHSAQVELSYPFYSIGERLAIRPYARDFFSDTDNSFEGLSYRDKGIVLHDILSRINTPADVEASVDEAIDGGSLSDRSRDRVVAFMKKRVKAHPEFFCGGSAQTRILNETSLIDADGSEHRPDRVIIHPDGRVVIVDYKFGSPKPEYDAQIAGYRQAFLDMGYTRVEAHLWYVYQNRVD